MTSHARVLFLDETGAVTNLVRTYGRSPEGERCLDDAPAAAAGHWKIVTAVAAIRLDGLTASATLPHAMDGQLFVTYVELALRAGDVVVMDNLPGHRLPQVRKLIESASAKLLYLPPYSPDFNPIEMIWSKVKRLLRSMAARTVSPPSTPPSAGQWMPYHPPTSSAASGIAATPRLWTRRSVAPNGLL